MKISEAMACLWLVMALACASVTPVEGSRVKDLNNLSQEDRAALQQSLKNLDPEALEAEEDEEVEANNDNKLPDAPEDGAEDEEDSDEDEEDSEISPTACDHCLKVDFYNLGKSCSCMFDCCRPFHYDEPNVNKLPLACQQYYYNTQQWKTCEDPCAYCSKTQYLGFKGQNECFHSCCAVELDDIGDDDTQLSYRISASCHDWQNALISTAF